MKIIRFILILFIGSLLTFLTYKTKYQTFFFEAIVWFILILIGISIFLWTVFKDIQSFKAERSFLNIGLTFLSLFFISIIISLQRQVNHTFNKPTRLKVFYDGDFNGTGIDFKMDGTYIFDISAIGISDYFYGTYIMDQNKIVMDKDTIDNFINLKYLEVCDKEIAAGKTASYLLQVDSLGNLIENSDEYRVVIDNRKK